LFRNVPNFLTILRLLVVPFVAHAIYTSRFERAAILIFAAGWTDALDGYLARHFQWTSRLGSYLDPLADKLLLITTYAALGLEGAAPVWLVGVVLGRDVLILAFVGIAFLFTKVRSFPPTIWGKLSTVVQIIFGWAIIVERAYFAKVAAPWEWVLFAVIAVPTAWSGIHYTYIALRDFPAARRAALNESSRGA
jgi:cardiolipin synthase